MVLGVGLYLIGIVISRAGGWDRQVSQALALGLSALGILISAAVVNQALGTRRSVSEAAPVEGDLLRVLREVEHDPSEELAAIRSDPQDIRQLAEQSGLVEALEKLAAKNIKADH